MRDAFSPPIRSFRYSGRMSVQPDPESLTVLLQAWKSSQGSARDKAWNAIYGRLHHLAHHVLRGRRAASGMATTTVLHEAAIELMNIDIDWNNSQHFFAAAARCMRFVLVDAARKRLSQKRGSGGPSEEMPEDVLDVSARNPEEVVAIHQALERLTQIDPRQGELVELRYFGGMSVEEAAEILGVSKATAVRQWRAARVWLYGQLKASGVGDSLPDEEKNGAT